ncbi:MAG TPA: hypothetical protein VM243_18475 [Phycisphaerae bacterium]|nr:hypothetical protein [Phycisphaerae bacterium]
MSDRPDQEEFADTFDDELKKRPSWTYGTKTQHYWYQTIQDAKDRLKIEDRAQKAKKNQAYATYDLDPAATVNAISRKLIAKAVNIVTDLPIVTPQFQEQDDEERWRDIVTALCQREMRSSELKWELRRQLWDNFTGDISWGMLSFESRFAKPQAVDPTADRRRVVEEQARIELEHQAAAMGQMLTVGPGDMHVLHEQLHRDFRDKMAQMVEQALLPDVLAMFDLHLADHRQAQQRVVAEKVRYQRVPPYLVYYDPDALKWADVEWYAIEFVERVEILKVNPQLRNTNALIGSAAVYDDPYHDRKPGHIDADQHSYATPREVHIRYWLVHSRFDNQMIVVAEHEQSDQLPLLVAPWPYPCDIVKPFVLNQVNDQVHGVSEIARLTRLHNELIDIRAKISDHARHVPTAKVAVDPSLATDKGLMRQLKDPKQIWVTVDPNKAKEIKFPNLDDALVNLAEKLDMELNEEAGTPEFAQAASVDETATATAARDRQFGTVLKDAKASLAEQVRWFCVSVVVIWRENGTTEQLVRIVGDRGRDWRSFSPTDLPYGVTFEVDADSLSPTQRDLAKKEARELVETLAPFMNPAPCLDTKAVLTPLIRRSDLTEDVNDLFMDPDPLLLQQQMMQAQQMSGMSAQMANPEVQEQMLQRQQQQQMGTPPMNEPMAGPMAGAQAGGAM